MNKKILILIILFVVLVLTPTVKVNATQVYVGVQVTNATAPGCVSNVSWACGANYSSYPNYTVDSNWCLPGGDSSGYGTQLTIQDSSGNNLTAISPSTNPIYPASPACVGGNTMWSGLFNLTSGTSYKVYLSSTTGSCPGYVDYYGNCWVAGQVGQSCCSICSHYGLTRGTDGDINNCASDTDCYSLANEGIDDSTCAIEAALMGSACSSCTINSSYSYFNPTSKACFSAAPNGEPSYYEPCSYSNPSFARVCWCSYDGYTEGVNSPTFTFSFTPSF